MFSAFHTILKIAGSLALDLGESTIFKYFTIFYNLYPFWSASVLGPTWSWSWSNCVWWNNHHLCFEEFSWPQFFNDLWITLQLNPSLKPRPPVLTVVESLIMDATRTFVLTHFKAITPLRNLKPYISKVKIKVAENWYLNLCFLPLCCCGVFQHVETHHTMSLNIRANVFCNMKPGNCLLLINLEIIKLETFYDTSELLLQKSGFRLKLIIEGEKISRRKFSKKHLQK